MAQRIQITAQAGMAVAELPAAGERLDAPGVWVAQCQVSLGGTTVTVERRDRSLRIRAVALPGTKDVVRWRLLPETPRPKSAPPPLPPNEPPT